MAVATSVHPAPASKAAPAAASNPPAPPATSAPSAVQRAKSAFRSPDGPAAGASNAGYRSGGSVLNRFPLNPEAPLEQRKLPSPPIGAQTFAGPARTNLGGASGSVASLTQSLSLTLPAAAFDPHATRPPRLVTSEPPAANPNSTPPDSPTPLVHLVLGRPTPGSRGRPNMLRAFTFAPGTSLEQNTRKLPPKIAKPAAAFDPNATRPPRLITSEPPAANPNSTPPDSPTPLVHLVLGRPTPGSRGRPNMLRAFTFAPGTSLEPNTRKLPPKIAKPAAQSRDPSKAVPAPAIAPTQGTGPDARAPAPNATSELPAPLPAAIRTVTAAPSSSYARYLPLVAVVVVGVAWAWKAGYLCNFGGRCVQP